MRGGLSAGSRGFTSIVAPLSGALRIVGAAGAFAVGGSAGALCRGCFVGGGLSRVLRCRCTILRSGAKFRHFDWRPVGSERDCLAVRRGGRRSVIPFRRSYGRSGVRRRAFARRSGGETAAGKGALILALRSCSVASDAPSSEGAVATGSPLPGSGSSVARLPLRPLPVPPSHRRFGSDPCKGRLLFQFTL